MKEAQDLVLYAPKEEMFPDLFVGRHTPNPPREKRAEMVADFGEPFDGYQGFLVRTALVRSSEYNDKNRPKVVDSGTVYDICQFMQDEEQENLVVICVDSSKKLMAIHRLAIGTDREVITNMRLVVRAAVLTGASGIYIAHNHPEEESPRPSPADVKTTASAIESSKCLGIEFLDHVIIGGGGGVMGSYFSFRDAGLLDLNVVDRIIEGRKRRAK